jgi:hypothetical protein
MTERHKKLVVLWTTGDREVALSMVLMYTLNAKLRGWWEDVTLVIWGSSTRVLAWDRELQDHVRAIKDAGVTLLACRWCAEMFEIAEDLEELGIELKYIGEPFTELLKSDARLIAI